ncbi:transglycosylase domain-containing protein [Oribacterium asaccharolyticum]|uniref:transglycosylase domain-containing protein n=1 Tax=Oribacterium asaccharolyticum TaxID=1501332 RepID=UPI0028EBBBB7|nr:transglycosylase domain-containing protein [Oribacterium asaccharolyticum]
MKFTRHSIENRLYEMKSKRARIWHRFTGILKTVILFCFVASLFLGASFGYGLFRGILDSAPDIHKIHVGPTSYATKIYDKKGNLMSTLVTEGSNRERVSYEELPKDMINAFVAIEDERFWRHNGIDFRSILRAVRGVVSDDSSAGGGSTITQQLLKNNVFGGGLHEGKFEKYVRKIQEQYLALELEDQPGLDKKEIKKSILTEYLNTINLGANTLGVKVAARRYFNKEVSELSLSESTVIAAITKNPSKLNPITHPENNAVRRKQVLHNMLSQGYIDESRYQEALNDPVYERIQNVNLVTQGEDKPYSYYTDELTEQVVDALMERLDYKKEDATKLLYSGGLTIYANQDPDLQAIVDQEINNPENYDTAKYSISWRYTLQHEDGTIVNFSEKDIEKYLKEGKGISFNGLYTSKDQANKRIEEFKEKVTVDSDRILGETVDYVLEPQASFVLMDPHTGEVLALTGGRGEKKQSKTLNRASNVLRQPGSTFKIITSFAPAIDLYGATLASTYYDSEYTLGNKTFKNWYSGGYLGFQSIRDGIVYSLNIVAVRCLMETVKPERGYQYAESLGITSLVKDDENPALALGGLTRGVSNLELTQAFSAIANGGELEKAKFFSKIVDQDGKVLIDTTEDKPTQVMKATTAYLLTDAMKESMESNRAFASDVRVSSTSTRAHFDGMSQAGKSGTTSNNRDIWFIGYTPYYIGGVWGGCDDNQVLKDAKTGEYNGGTGFHKDIWRKIMTKIHEGKTDPGFSRPEDIVEAQVCRKSGKLPTSGCYQDYRGSAVITELFAKGTVPTEKCTYHTSWGAMLVPENLRDLDTDDHYYSYKEPEEEEEDEDSERDSDSSEKNTKNKITISEQGPSKKKSAED